jgi:tripartite-type tricarboxylate transporter receptor subunit TctC
MDPVSRRRFLGASVATALGGILSPRLAQAQAMLEAVKLVTGFPPGGTSDNMCRRLAERLRGNYARTALVENRTGASGQIAVESMKTAPTDGSVLLHTPASMLMIYPHIYKKLSYDPFQDVIPVSLGASFVFGFAVGAAVPDAVRNVPEFLSWCKANPRLANFGTPAAGSVPHFLGALLAKASGVDLRHVGYRGTQPAIIDMMGGQISAVCGPLGDFIHHAKAGKLRLLATSGAERSRFAAGVPTFVEQGYPGVEAAEWYGFFVPGKTQAAVIQRANAALRAALSAPDMIDGLALMGIESRSSTPEELARLLRADYEHWGPIVRSVGFTADS